MDLYVGATQAIRLVIGDDDRAPTTAELDSMKAIVRDSMKQGAFGLSSSLQYPPAPYAKTDELIALAAESAHFGGIYATHLRSDGDTILPAQRMRLIDRGVLKKGMCADIVIFDPETIGDLATFDKPNQLSEGMAYVLVNGVPVIDNGKATNTLPGRVLRGRRARRKGMVPTATSRTMAEHLTGLSRCPCRRHGDRHFSLEKQF